MESWNLLNETVAFLGFLYCDRSTNQLKKENDNRLQSNDELFTKENAISL